MRGFESQPTRFAGRTTAQARGLALGFAVAFGYVLFVALAHDTVPHKLALPAESAGDPLYQNDILFYRRMAAHVRDGMAYHDAAAVELRSHGFQARSLFHWRLPTYTWVLAALPDLRAARLVLAALSVVALALLYGAERRELGVVPAGLTVVLALGVNVWWVSADAVFWPEVWAAVLLGMAVGAVGVGRIALGVAAATAALCWRELALPYLVVGFAVACRNGDRRERALWLLGLAVFAGFLTFHGYEVFRRLDPNRDSLPLGASEWVQFGGVAFHLMGLRTNLALSAAPGWVLSLYLGFAALGLAGWRGRRGTWLGLTAAVYLAAFSVIGKPYNFYWGGLLAPILPLGIARALAAVRDLARAAFPPRRAGLDGSAEVPSVGMAGPIGLVGGVSTQQSVWRR